MCSQSSTDSLRMGIKRCKAYASFTSYVHSFATTSLANHTSQVNTRSCLHADTVRVLIEADMRQGNITSLIPRQEVMLRTRSALSLHTEVLRPFDLFGYIFMIDRRASFLHGL